MLPTHEHVATYRGYDIFRRRPGFEFTPMTLGKIASFLVRGPDGSVAVFAFLYSMPLALRGQDLDEERLLEATLRTIEAVIDGGAIGERQDMTFEWHAGGWLPVENPRWWIPTEW